MALNWYFNSIFYWEKMFILSIKFYITGFVKLRGNSNSLDRWLAIPQHTGEKTINITVNHAYWSWKHYMTVYFLAYLFGNRQIYEHRRTHGSFSWFQRDSKRGLCNFRRILISGVFDLQFSVMLYNSKQTYACIFTAY